MDQNTETEVQTPTETPMETMTPTEEKAPTSSIVGILVIVLILAFGAFYFLKQVPTPAPSETLTPAEAQADPTVSTLSEQGTSTDLTSIENDLNATDLSGVGAGLDNISI